jgi:hypothetical protein
MTTMMENVERFEDRYLEQVKKAEEPVLRFAGDMSERMARFVPERPSFMDDMPLMADFVESQLKFRKRFVDEQLRFARKMVKALHPVMEKVDHLPEKPVRKVAKAA